MGGVLLISANREHFPEPIFPVGVAYVAGELTRRGFEVSIFDAGLSRFPHHALARAITESEPELIGLSLRNIDNSAFPCTRHYVDGYRKLVATIRSRTRAPIILGGPAFSIYPQVLLRALGCDGGVVADGEGSVIRWCTGARGLLPAERSSLDLVGFPARVDAIFPELHRYRTIGIQTARGCPHRCVYCTYPVLEGTRLRLRSPAAVVDEIELVHRRGGQRDFFFVDSSFNADEAHMAAICRELIARALPIRFSCYLSPRLEELSHFRLLAKAGCRAVDFGTDTASEPMLRSLRKGFTVDDLRRASAACREAGIDFCHSLLFGGPGECAATVEETLRCMDEVNPKAVIAMTGIRVYPGTAIARAAAEAGLISPEDDLLEPRFYFDGEDEVLDAITAHAAARRNWFLPGDRDWSSALGPRLLRLVHRSGPLWTALRPARTRPAPVS